MTETTARQPATDPQAILKALKAIDAFLERQERREREAAGAGNPEMLGLVLQALVQRQAAPARTRRKADPEARRLRKQAARMMAMIGQLTAARLGTEAPASAAAKGNYVPCHDDQGHWTACPGAGGGDGGAGGGKPRKPGRAKPRKPRKPKPGGGGAGGKRKPILPTANRVTHADQVAARETPAVAHPKSDADVPRFIKEVEATPVYKAVNAKITALAKESPGGDVRQWSLGRNTVNGHLTPEREALHEKIAGEILNPKAAAKDGERPKVAILMGPPGSGKTTGGQPQAERISKEFTVVNADDIKAKLPEYQGWNAAAVHEESAHIAEGLVFKKAIAERHHVLMDLTGANGKKMKEMVDDFARNGYDVHLINIDLPAYKSVGRAWDRFAKNAFGHADPKGEPGRYVPPDYVYNTVDDKPKTTYAELKKHPAVKSYVSVSTDVGKGEKPRVTDEGGER